MGNGTSIRNFDCLTAGSKGMSRDGGALLPNDHPLTCVVRTPSGAVDEYSRPVLSPSILVTGTP